MKKILPPLLLLLVGFVAYAPALQNGFVWDDHALVLRDPLIRSWRLIPESFNHFLFLDVTASDFYRPLQRVSYALEYAAVGLRPALYHFDSILLHLLAALALYFFGREFWRAFEVDERQARWSSFGAAAIWMLHPVHSSAVIYVAGRADLLAALFGFAGLICALISSRTRRASQLLWVILSALLLLLSALSKESGLIFLAVWLVIHIAERKWRALIRAGIATLFVLVIYASLRFAAEHIPAPIPAPVPLLVRPIVFARAVAEYTGLLLFPTHLQMERDVMTHPFGSSNASLNLASWRELQTLAGILLLAGFVVWLWRERKRDRAIYLCLLLAALTYLPVSTVFSLNATVAEHWLYLPSAFLFLAGARRTWLFINRQSSLLVRQFFWAVLALWILFLGGRTFARTFDWKDDRTFLERTIAGGGTSARMLINFGGLELREGRLEEAKKNLQAALAREPDQPFAILNLAAVAIKQSDFKTAHELLSRATQMPLVEAETYEMMAVLEAKETGLADARRLRLASRTGPPHWAIEQRYVKLLDELGATDAAIGEVIDCLRTQWYRAASWQLLAELLRKKGRTAEAEKASENAHRYDVQLDETESISPAG